MSHSGLETESETDFGLRVGVGVGVSQNLINDRLELQGGPKMAHFRSLYIIVRY